MDARCSAGAALVATTAEAYERYARASSRDARSAPTSGACATMRFARPPHCLSHSCHLKSRAHSLPVSLPSRKRGTATASCTESASRRRAARGRTMRHGSPFPEHTAVGPTLPRRWMSFAGASACPPGKLAPPVAAASYPAHGLSIASGLEEPSAAGIRACCSSHGRAARSATSFSGHQHFSGPALRMAKSSLQRRPARRCSVAGVAVARSRMPRSETFEAPTWRRELHPRG